MAKNWKRAEADVASFFGVTRTPLSGGNSKITRADIIHGEVFAEVKYREKHSAVQLWDNTKRLADKEGKIPVVCLKERGRQGFWVLVKSGDLQRIADLSVRRKIPIAIKRKIQDPF